MQKPNELTEWEYFVWRHKDTENLYYHLVSYLISLFALVWAIYTRNYWWILIIPPAQYIGFLGHVVSKEGQVRNKDFISPWTTVYLTRIFCLVAIGKYRKTITAVSIKAKAAGLS